MARPVVVACALSAVAVWCRPVSAQEPSDPVRDLAAIYDELGIQRELPEGRPDPWSRANDSSGKSAPTDTGRGSIPVPPPNATPAPPLPAVPTAAATILLWTLGGVGILLIAAWLVRERRRSVVPTPRGSGTEPRPQPTSRAEPVHPDRFRALIESGDYLPAVHGMLLDGMGRSGLNLSRVTGRPESRTSREVLDLVPHDAAYRAPLRDLVTVVERGLFARTPLTRDDAEQAFAAHARLLAVVSAESRAPSGAASGRAS